MLSRIKPWLIAALLLGIQTSIVVAGIIPLSSSDPSLLFNRYAHSTTPYNVDVDKVKRDLGGILSPASLVFGPKDYVDTDLYGHATDRWNKFAPPDIQVVVQVGVEADVAKIVAYCNRNSIDFYAVNRGHAMTSSVALFKGLQIDLGLLTEMTIDEDKETGLFQGGVYGQQVTDYLWAKGYLTTTGSCTCVGLMGAGLGGGHGRLEGHYGLISDNFVNLNVVLANGTEVTVSSTSHPDLFWAMQGAGHNFGIVTSAELKIHPKETSTWHYHNYVWAGDKLEQVFSALNTLHHGNGTGTTPVDMAVNFGVYRIIPEISNTTAVIYWTFAYSGSAADAEDALSPFTAIPALTQEQGDVPYPDIARVQGTDLTGPLCAENLIHVTSTAGLLKWNVTAQRQIYEHFNAQIARYPALKFTTTVGHEAYSNRAVKDSFPDWSQSAFPWRAENHLTYFDCVVPDAQKDNATLKAAARTWANEVRDLWNQGEEEVSSSSEGKENPRIYVNYASGMLSGEGYPLEATYGYESWRLDKLREIKKEYDPLNRFRFFEPIVREDSVKMVGYK